MGKDIYQQASDDQSVGSLACTTPVGISEQPPASRRRYHSQSNNVLEIEKEEMSVQRHSVAMLLLLIATGLILSLYPFVMEEDGDINSALIQTFVAAGCFVAIIMLFIRYDAILRRRHSALLVITKRSKGIVDQLFPSGVRDRLLRADNFSNRSSEDGNLQSSDHGLSTDELTKRNTLKNQAIKEASPETKNLPTLHNVSILSLLPGSNSAMSASLVKRGDEGKIAQAAVAGVGRGGGGTSDEHAIAEWYPATTVLFADIAGFTAWSAQRTPQQVFKLLETIYNAFDEIAGTLGVFKVETIGDCYMAVTGLPEPNDDHAINMARFAYQCILRMSQVTQELESALGPGTSALNIRCGLHSGSVTGGVLRGQKSRFQLFGDTVNTASRMESTGMIGKIQVSAETADELIAKGKVHWLKPREDKIVAKGKGQLDTFWLEPRKKAMNASSLHDTHHVAIQISPEAQVQLASGTSKIGSAVSTPVSANKVVSIKSLNSSRVATKEQRERLVEYNTDVLLKPLIQSMSARHTASLKAKKSRSVRQIDHSTETFEPLLAVLAVSDSIPFPDFDPTRVTDAIGMDDATEIRQDLRAYVFEIAALYGDIPFHNFEHASHVLLATNKLMDRMYNQSKMKPSHLHEMTYGISSDPLARFAMLLASLIHDVGHTGIPNAVLVKEEARIALMYDNESVAEQHSLTLAWKTLMKPRYEKLRSCIYEDNVERKRFRSILVNAVMATDISNRDLLQMRTEKWVRLFPVNRDETARESKARMHERATALLETIIQVANVSHTMQDWTIYRRWNEKLFVEMRLAYGSGRALDPSEHWYRGELAFYDHYVLPLAKRLEESGIYTNQYFKFALKNRSEWESTGIAVVEAMVTAQTETVEQEEFDDNDSILEGASTVVDSTTKQIAFYSMMDSHMSGLGISLGDDEDIV